MSIKPGGNNSRTGRVMPAIGAVGIRNATGGGSIPAQVRPVLAERPSQTDVTGQVSAGIGTGEKIMQTELVRMRYSVINGEKNILRIPLQEIDHCLPRTPQ